MDKIIKCIAAIASGLCGFLFGEIDGLMYALIAFMLIDYVTGVLAALAKKELSSKIGFVGIAKKAVMLALVAVGHIVDVYILVGDGTMCRSAVAGLYIANEGMSILENADKLGIPLPNIIKSVFKQLKNKSESKDDKEE